MNHYLEDIEKLRVAAGVDVNMLCNPYAVGKETYAKSLSSKLQQMTHLLLAYEATLWHT